MIKKDKDKIKAAKKEGLKGTFLRRPEKMQYLSLPAHPFFPIQCMECTKYVHSSFIDLMA